LTPCNWHGFAEVFLRSRSPHAYLDKGAGIYRFAAFEDGRLQGAIFVSPGPVAVARSWIADQLGKPAALQILAGHGGRLAEDHGGIVCACNNVGRNTILSAIARGADTFGQIGVATGAGTACGSCRSEIKAMLRTHPLQAAEWMSNRSPNNQRGSETLPSYPPYHATHRS
jgi:assimilatory nitrate reductase catalytic subunit